MKNIKILTLTFLVLIAAVIFAACSPDNVQAQRTVQVLILPSRLDPAMSNDEISDYINAKIHSTLVNICDETSQPMPALAIMWDKPDERTITMMLRRDALFHNGDTLTAYDAAFSLMRGGAVLPGEIFGAIEHVKVHNDLNFTIYLSENSQYSQVVFMTHLASPNAAVLPRGHMLAVGEDAFAAEPVGAGAYVFEYLTAGERVSLVRNPNYWGESPYYERIVFKIGPNGS